jgi:hypothetical protein
MANGSDPTSIRRITGLVFCTSNLVNTPHNSTLLDLEFLQTHHIDLELEWPLT